MIISTGKRCIVYPIILTPLEESGTKQLFVGQVGPYQVVVGDHYYNGQLGVHIPVGAIIPDNIAEEMLVKGRLGGNQKNRVVAKNMFGYVSNGLFYGSQGVLFDHAWQEGTDVTDIFGIKFSPGF